MIDEAGDGYLVEIDVQNLLVPPAATSKDNCDFGLTVFNSNRIVKFLSTNIPSLKTKNLYLKINI